MKLSCVFLLVHFGQGTSQNKAVGLVTRDVVCGPSSRLCVICGDVASSQPVGVMLPGSKHKKSRYMNLYRFLLWLISMLSPALSGHRPIMQGVLSLLFDPLILGV